MHHDKQPQTHFRFYWLHDEANVNAYHEITQWLEQEHCEQGSRILPICIQACAASSIIDFDFNSERACLASHVRAWREYTRSLPTNVAVIFNDGIAYDAQAWWCNRVRDRHHLMDVMHDAPADWEILVIGINESQPPKRAPRRRDESACALRRVGTGSQVPPKQHAFRRWMGVPNRRAREEPWKALKCYVVRNRSVAHKACRLVGHPAITTLGGVLDGLNTYVMCDPIYQKPMGHPRK